MDRGWAASAARWRVPLGFAFGVAYLILSQPTVRRVEVGGGIALLGLCLRASAAGYLDKNLNLATDGPYRFTRNPLYLGSSLMGLGAVVAGNSWWLGLLFMILLVSVYWPVMRREERFLVHQFGESYLRYAAHVPFCLPRGRSGPASGKTFRWERYRKNREYEAALGYIAGVVFLVLKILLR